jgi:hypothetical protein
MPSVSSTTIADGIDRVSVLAQYLYKVAGKTPTNWEQKGVAVAAYTVAALCKYSVLRESCAMLTRLSRGQQQPAGSSCERCDWDHQTCDACVVSGMQQDAQVRG